MHDYTNDVWRTIAKYMAIDHKQHRIEKTDFEITAEGWMITYKKGTGLVLSDTAQEIVDTNALGEFTVRHDQDLGLPVIIAPDDFARTMFRLAF